MVDAADFTRERLIYLEIKDRQTSKLGYPLTDDQLRDIIADLAQRARTNPVLNAKELLPLITVPGGDEADIYEEITGGLLIPKVDAGIKEKYQVDPLRLVYGLGLLLAEELRSESSKRDSEMEEFLASWFEPQPDMDRKVDICGSALFHALFQTDFPQASLRVLLRYWLGLRNWADTAQDAFATYVLRCPQLFVEVADNFWSSAHDSGAAQDFLGTAFVEHRDDDRLQPVLARAIRRWMGFVHPLGRHFWGYDTKRQQHVRKILEAQIGQPIAFSEDIGEEEATSHAIESRAGVPITEGEIEVVGIPLTVISDGYLLRMARFGLMIMSAGDRQPFANALVNWAVASAVMDDSEFSDVVSWVVRLSNDRTEDTLIAEIRRLLARNEPTASAAARILLLVIGSRESNSIIETHGLVSPSHEAQRDQHAADPRKSFFQWSESESIGCLGRPDVPLHFILQRAALPILDPKVTVPSSLVDRAKEALRSIDPAKIRSHSMQTIEAHDLQTLAPILSAYAPFELAEFLRVVIRGLPNRDVNGQYFLAIQFPELSLLFKSEEMRAVSRTIDVLLSGSSEWTFDDRNGPPHRCKIAEARAFSALAPHLSSSEFFSRFISRPLNALDLLSLQLWFTPLSREKTAELISYVHNPQDRIVLIRILWALPHMGISLTESDRSVLAQLAEREDSKVRAGVMRIAVLTEDTSLGRRLVGQCGTTTHDTDLWESEWLTRLLSIFSDNLVLEDVAKRVPAYMLGFIIEERGNRPNEIELYARCLDEEARRVVSAIDPDIGALPEIQIITDPDLSAPRLPELNRPAHSHPVRLRRSHSWTSGRPTDTVSGLQAVLRADDDEAIRELNEDTRRRVKAILAAWRTDAFQWYGRAFPSNAMAQIYGRFPTIVERWIEPALHNDTLGLSARVRLGTFLEPICRMLLDLNPRVGLRLWQVIHKKEITPISFDTVDIAFGAENSPESTAARDGVLDECWSDEAIAKIALSCVTRGRNDWLNTSIQALTSAKQLWRKAKGLTLASFSDITVSGFEALVSAAAIKGTWVERGLRTLKEHVRKNQLARHWYSVFLNAPDPDAAWGALEIVLSLADERLLHWRVELEDACANKDLAKERLRFLSLRSNRRDLRNELSRDSDRKEQLFGEKIPQGEIVPFM
jgi:hypothetical protein